MGCRSRDSVRLARDRPAVSLRQPDADKPAEMDHLLSGYRNPYPQGDRLAVTSFMGQTRLSSRAQPAQSEPRFADRPVYSWVIRACKRPAIQHGAPGHKDRVPFLYLRTNNVALGYILCRSLERP